jgi:hypothetical protein
MEGAVVSAPNYADAGPLLVEALEAQVEADKLTQKLADTRNTTDVMELMPWVTQAKARALRLREAALARVRGVDPIDAMVADARGIKAS